MEAGEEAASRCEKEYREAVDELSGGMTNDGDRSNDDNNDDGRMVNFEVPARDV